MDHVHVPRRLADSAMVHRMIRYVCPSLRRNMHVLYAPIAIASRQP